MKMPDGQIFSNIFDEDFWAHYLAVYDRLHIVARAEPAPPAESRGAADKLLTDPRIEFREVPYYKGPAGFLFALLPLLSFLWRLSRLEGTHLLRLPGAIGGLALPFLLLRQRRYGVELVGDPIAVFTTGGVGGRLAFAYKFFFASLTKLACKHASATSYVTREVLQRLYPPKAGGLAINWSCVQLPAELISAPRVIHRTPASPAPSIIVVGSLEQRYKGFDVMINAVGLLRNWGRPVRLRIAGDGRYRDELEAQVARMALGEQVEFLGNLPRTEVLAQMDRADLFVMPSRTEGLPRALIEAMARGLPALGSKVGGIPELLPEECLFENEDFTTLATMIHRLIDDGARLSAMSARNVAEAGEYELGRMTVRREAFYRFLAADASR